MTQENLLSKIEKGNRNFLEVEFFTDIEIIIDGNNSIYGNQLKFQRCKFSGNVQIRDIFNESFTIAFIECKFNNVNITNSRLHSIYFSKIEKLNVLEIFLSNTKLLQIDSNDKSLIANVIIDSSYVQNLLCEHLNLDGTFDLSLSSEDDEFQNIQSSFEGAHFTTFICSRLNSKNINFKKFSVYSATFKENNFNKANFDNSDFGYITFFDNCKFESNSSFRNCQNHGDLIFSSCLFKTFAHFNESRLKHFQINHTAFENKVSFDMLSVESIFLYQVTFSKQAYFDDLKIRDIHKDKFLKKIPSSELRLWRRTLRTIKQELQKSDNKIDYNRFRSYELAAYYRELKWDWKDSKDKFILGSTWLATGFDHSWQRALVFTILSGFGWYSIVYFAEYNGSNNPDKINTFFTGAFRFFLITDFSNPFKNKNEFFENAFMWIPLIFGKIFIAFGIYEMIQAFRKFKA